MEHDANTNRPTLPGGSTPIERAGARTDAANIRTDQANIRTEQAETRSDAPGVSELRFRRLFESSREGILLLDAHTGHVTDANSSLIELLGFSRNEMVGKTIGELGPFANLVANQAMLEQLQRDGYVRYEDLPLETKDGRHIAVEFVSNVYLVGNQKMAQCNIRDITDRKRAEKELEDLRHKYELILNSTVEGIHGIDVQGNITFENAASLAMLGWEMNELIGQQGHVLMHHSHADGSAYPLSECPIHSTLRDGIVRRVNNEVFWRKNGTSFPVEYVVSAKRDAQGAIIGAVVVFGDITERKQAAAVLQESRALYLSLVDQLPAGVFRKDVEGRYVFTNTWFCQLKGLEPDDMLGKTPQELLDYELSGQKPAEAVIARETRLAIQGESHHQAIMRTGRPIEVEEEYSCPNGKPRHLHAVKTPVFDANGKVVGSQGILFDITEKKAVDESHIRLAMAVEQAAETIVITDTAGNIVYANPAFAQNTGYTVAEALGKNPRILKSGKHDAAFYRQMWDVLGRGEVWHGHMINRGKDGKLYEEEATISPIRGATGKVVNYVAVKRDVTREVQLESQFRQSQKMEAIGTLAGGVAHDFNNILAVIQIQASLLKCGSLSDEQVGFADDIGLAVQRAAALTRQLLLFSRKEVLQARDFDLNQSVSDMTRMLIRILGEHIAVQLKLAAEPMFLHADPGMLDQVLMNLAVNARDAMLNGGRLIIETAGVEFDEFAATQTAQARPGSFVRLSVSDTGCGIPPENLSKIFEPFFTTKDVGKGSGLGLATVFGVVQQHKGWINVYSEVGHGTAFKIYLPRLAGMTERKQAENLLATSPTGHETILLAEDEAPLRTAMRTSLARLGYRILEASTGSKALEVWKEHRAAIHLLLTDLMMPEGMTGKELAECILQENPELKVIYMSGYSADIVGKNPSFQEGVNFLTKPFEALKLAQTVRNRLDKA